MNGNLHLVQSLLNARMRRTTAPEMLGATVNRLVFTVLYPRRWMITGRNSWTACRGTPRQTWIPKITQLVPCLNTLNASRISSFSLTTEELSICKRRYASSFSSGVRKLASEADRGRYQSAKRAKRTVPAPSIKKRYLQGASGPVWMRKIPNASNPEKAEAMVWAA